MRLPHMSDDDAVAVNVNLNDYISDAINNAIPMLYEPNEAPIVGKVQVVIAGTDGPIKHRMMVKDLQQVLSFDKETFVLEKEHMSPSTGGHITTEQGAVTTRCSNQQSSVKTFPTTYSEAPISIFANGESESRPTSSTGKRTVYTDVRSTETHLPVNMQSGNSPVRPSGTKRDDGLTMLSGDVHSQVEPSRLRRVNGSIPPHQQTSDWWGHAGHDPEGLSGSWHHPVPHQKKGHGPARNSNFKDNVTSMNGSMCPSDNSEVQMTGVGRKHIHNSAGIDHLDSNLSPPPAKRHGLRIVDTVDKIDHLQQNVEEQDRKYGLGAGLRNQVNSRDSSIQINSHLSDSKTFASSAVSGLFDTQKGSTSPPQEPGDFSLESSMARKGRPAPPSSFGWGSRPGSPEILEPPPVRGAGLDNIKKLLQAKIALFGGHGSRGECQNAWRHLAEGKGHMSIEEVLCALETHFSITMEVGDLVALIGVLPESDQFTFRHFCALSRATTSSAGTFMNVTPPTGQESRVQFGNNGIRCHAQRTSIVQAPFGVQGDQVSPYRSHRRAF